MHVNLDESRVGEHLTCDLLAPTPHAGWHPRIPTDLWWRCITRRCWCIPRS
jgi:hypothetical protein